LRYYIERAVKDFKTLVIYFNVTRPQMEAKFKENGKFSLEKLLSITRYINAGWKAADDKEKYNKLSAAYNYTFGIPNELVKKVLGVYVDENGRHVKIPVEKIVQHLRETGFIDEPVGNGTKVVKDKKDGKFRAVCYWRKKYPLANVKYWLKLMSDKLYSNIKTFPNASDRIKKIIMKWHDEWGKKKTERKTERVENTSNGDLAERFEKDVERYVNVKAYSSELKKFKALWKGIKLDIYETVKKAWIAKNPTVIENLKTRFDDDWIVDLMKNYYNNRLAKVGRNS
jgi:hypothetical protein